MRIFRTLFSKRGLPQGLHGQFWERLAGSAAATPAEMDIFKLVFEEMAAKTNVELDEAIANDESEMRYPVMKSR